MYLVTKLTLIAVFLTPNGAFEVEKVAPFEFKSVESCLLFARQADKNMIELVNNEKNLKLLTRLFTCNETSILKIDV
jgi:hypothetical protein